ncbi:hypothetical protein J2S07_001056 [Robertmurraya andreesenii]|uniref:Uncharacterized protein n=1 Tax=Anoxybacillus andreesenii TaxID=1325932 RepID=A0ABT9V1C1_9BACL|nr:hypothetical protein [Robertmurraya andreesenii]
MIPPRDFPLGGFHFYNKSRNRSVLFRMGFQTRKFSGSCSRVRASGTIGSNPLLFMIQRGKNFLDYKGISKFLLFSGKTVYTNGTKLYLCDLFYTIGGIGKW